MKTRSICEDLKTFPGRLGLRLLELAAERNANVLLFVDQLEELETIAEEARARRGRHAAALGVHGRLLVERKAREAVDAESEIEIVHESLVRHWLEALVQKLSLGENRRAT